MNAFKAIFAVISALCNVILKLISSVERGANALDHMAEAGEKKAKNFKELIDMNDEAEFDKQKAKINAKRITQGLAPIDKKSSQQQAVEKQAEDKAKEAEAKAKAEEAKSKAEDDLLG